MDDAYLFYSVFVVCLINLIASFLLNRRFQRENPSALPFRWGYFLGLSSLIFGIYILSYWGTIIFFGFLHNSQKFLTWEEMGTIFLPVLASIFMVGTGWFVLRRQGWILLLAHIFILPLFVAVGYYHTIITILPSLCNFLQKHFPDFYYGFDLFLTRVLYGKGLIYLFSFWILFWIMGGIYVKRRWKEMLGEITN